MRELFELWKHTRMVVFVAVSAACYVAVLLPFKVAVIIPGLTEVRPGAAIPVLFSFLFGPAAAFGAGFGNLIADMLGGMLGIGSLFGFLGNFLYGFIPYALWRAFRGYARPGAKGLTDWMLVSAIILVSCLAIGAVIGWGVDLLGLAPFAALGNIIALNNLLSSCVLAIPLLALTYGRVEQGGLLWHEIMEETGRGATRYRILGAVLLVLGTVSAMIIGNVISLGYLDVAFGAAGFMGVKGTSFLAAGMLPPLILLLAGCLLL
jgi:energy-coupling factor transport system substrate-specific component